MGLPAIDSSFPTIVGRTLVLDRSTTVSKSETVGDGSEKEGEVGEWESPGVGGTLSLSFIESGEVVGVL